MLYEIFFWLTFTLFGCLISPPCTFNLASALPPSTAQLMRRFFECLDSLHNYSLQLGHGVLDPCRHCHSTTDWTSHGFVYKKDHGGQREVVGKRVFCSNRGRKTGCGHTMQLYLHKRIPGFHHAVSAVVLFVVLLSRWSVSKAYQMATGARSSRNAYRWLAELYGNLAAFRSFPAKTDSRGSWRSTLSKSATVIVETFYYLIGRWGIRAGEYYQYNTQQGLFLR